MFFQYQTVYIGESLKEFQAIRDLLDLKGIKYKYALIQNPNAHHCLAGPALRKDKLYEIKVHKDRVEEAKYYMHSKD